jgi:heparanase 1
MRIRSLMVCSLLASLGCPSPGPDRTVADVIVTKDAVVATTDERFVGYALDTSQVVGGDWWAPSGYEEPTDPYDFDRERLNGLVSALGPSRLRIGGTEADVVFIDVSDDPVAEPPEGFEHVFTAEQVLDVCAFANRHDLTIFWTLNAGPGTRDDSGAWTEEEARKIIPFLVDNDCPVDVFELGNEINGYYVLHGLALDATQYAADLARASALLDELAPGIPLAGPSSAYWPIIGEFGGILPPTLEQGGEFLDIVSWHYYPQQSERCPVASRVASVDNLFDPANLDEVGRWSTFVRDLAAEHAPGARVVLGETGHAQCGGQQGLSGTYVSLFWWLDQLGMMARQGQAYVIRQTLTGADYQMVNEQTLAPLPDYWGSLLYRRLMGRRVLDAHTDGQRLLRSWAHCGRGPDAHLGGAGNEGVGDVTVLLTNLDRERELSARLEGLGRRHDVYLLEGDDLLGTGLSLNGERLEADEAGTLSGIAPDERTADTDEVIVALPPASMAFVHFPVAGAPACIGDR